MKISKIEEGSSLLPAIKGIERELKEKLQKAKIEAQERVKEEEAKRDKTILAFKEDSGKIYEEIYQEGLREIEKEAQEIKIRSEEELERLKKKYQHLVPIVAEKVFKEIFDLDDDN